MSSISDQVRARGDTEPAIPDRLENAALALTAKMAEAWRQGLRPRAEDFLNRCPELWEHPETALDLVYEEICLQQEHGHSVSVDEIVERFPSWRKQIEVLFNCQRLFDSSSAEPRFPETGETLGDFLLVASLGRGGNGRVFLARQESLAGREVVLKIVRRRNGEHLCLARLQHTHIVPLYAAADFPTRGLRALCMPYFGGATLAQLLEELNRLDPAQRSTNSLLAALDRISRISAPGAALDETPSPARRFLESATYVEAVCWIGACLADALQHAHDHGLIHLDLKPSNVLLAADGLPMLLDFHLARQPLDQGQHVDGIGGTLGYMSPEQRSAWEALRRGDRPSAAVDSRSDIYSLGIVLYEVLAGKAPVQGAAELLARCNPEVSVGLADIIGKCLEQAPDRRYCSMAAVATDLRRHLSHLPLLGARNRSPSERWRKWRLRRPHGVAIAGMMMALLIATGAVGLGLVNHYVDRREQGLAALRDAGVQVGQKEWEGAGRTLQRGLASLQGLPGQSELRAKLRSELELVEKARAELERAQLRKSLHELAERIRFVAADGSGAARALPALESPCRALWDRRDEIMARLTSVGGTGADLELRADLYDLAIFWADCQDSIALHGAKLAGAELAKSILDQAEKVLGPSPALAAERQRRVNSAAGAKLAAGTAWEHLAVGRAFMKADKLALASKELQEAVRLEPNGLWTNFLFGQCCYRERRFLEAVTAFSVCIGAAPEAAGCYYNRSLAFAAMGQSELAHQDAERARQLNPDLGRIKDSAPGLTSQLR
jgi:eukaryotic-like serine/threonine-protein kinase